MGFLSVLLESLVGFAAQLLRLSDLVTGGGVWALPQGVTPHRETLGECLAAIKAVWGKKGEKLMDVFAKLRSLKVDYYVLKRPLAISIVSNTRSDLWARINFRGAVLCPTCMESFLSCCDIFLRET